MTANIILVPGSAAVLYNDSIEPDPRYKSRLLSALALYQQLNDPFIILSGGVYQVSEAAAGESYLIEKGIPKERIIKVERALDTFENAEDFKHALEQFADYNLHLVTNSFHLPRAFLACLCFNLHPKLHSSDKILLQRYKGLPSSKEIISDACGNEDYSEYIGFFVYLVDVFTSFFGSLNFYPAHTLYQILSRKDRLRANPEWDKHKKGRYRYDIDMLDKLERLKNGPEGI
ncbi:MAG: YdcF family protein [Candidatus Aenigmatarchaeota archaeon]|nr:YdcF family protein [Candidatus Aenigmarchaeota archaeon]